MRGPDGDLWVLSLDPDDRTLRRPEDVEEELAAALPETQGRRFFPMLGGLAWHLAAFILLGAAAVILWRGFRTVSFEALVAAVAAWGWGSVATALGLSALSFLLMGCVEWLG